MGLVYYCDNCYNNKITLNTATVMTKQGKVVNRPKSPDGTIFAINATIQNGYIVSSDGNIINASQCPYCHATTNELSLTIEEWNVLKNVSTDSNFIMSMDKLKKDDVIDFNLKLSQFKSTVPQQKTKTQLIFSEQQSTPTCPTCGSTNVKKISGGRRWVSTGLFGLASSNLGKTMQCDSCGAKW